MRDTTETERVATFSDCRELPEAVPVSKPEVSLAIPEGIPLELVLTAAIDPATAAAGDVIAAKVKDPLLRPKSLKVLVPAGSIVTGRLFRVEHHPKSLLRGAYFVISMAFDRVEVNGAVSPFHVRLDKNTAIRSTPPTGQGAESFPEGLISFAAPQVNFVVPAGYTSKWHTIVPPSQ